MTGFGEARCQDGTLSVTVEVRTINSRYFKVSIRAGEGYASLESQIENLLRPQIKRGTVQLSLRVDRARAADEFKLNPHVLAGYRQQLEDLREKWQMAEPVRLEALLSLPGVVDENQLEVAGVEEEWPLIERTVQAAVDNLARMRIDEGRAMANDLAANGRIIANELTEIEKRAPTVAESYRSRLVERLSKILAEFQVTLSAGDLVREIGIYAERSDISEETVRLRSHLEQFGSIMELEESSGRKLEFVIQEMSRETNTIGSKANDVEIARHVIEIKAAIERIREMIQNVE